MKLGAWVWSPTEAAVDRTVALALWLVAVPLCLFVAALTWRATLVPAIEPLAGIERWIEPLPDARFDTGGFAVLAGQHPQVPDTAWQAVELPTAVAAPPLADIPGQAPMARLWLRGRYAPSGDEGSGQLAIHVPRVMGGAYAVWVNGRLLDANLTNWRMQWNQPLFVKLPADTALPATIELAVPYRLSQGYAVGSLYVGPAAVVENLFNWREFWQVLLPKASILITLLLGFIALGFWRSLPGERGYLYMGLSALGWFIANTQYLGDFLDDEASRWFSFWNDGAIAWVIAFLSLFALQLAERRLPRLEMSLIAYASGMSLVTLPVWHWDSAGLILQHYLDLAVSFGVFGYLTWLAFKRGSYEFKVSMAAIWTLPLMGLHTIYFLTSQRAPDLIHLFPYTSFVVFGAFLYVMQRRYLRARAALVDLNASLDQRLRDREAELAQQHGELLIAQQQKVLTDERQRLMRDMHDGIGSALMTSLSAAEHGQLDVAGAGAVLRECLDDLKLVIDSLEPVEHDLVALLGNLRYRFGERIKAAGIRIVWTMAELPPLPWLDPSRALQVLRIVQEALTNVLKHARATELRISAQPTPADSEPPAVVIEIADNGVGFNTENAVAGRGLKSLRYRATQLGAALTISTEPGRGTRISLRLPIASR